MRLLDLFKSFDKDQSWTITPEEFAIGIRNAGMDFSQRQMVALMQALDHNEDGEIDYKFVKYYYDKYVVLRYRASNLGYLS